VGEQMKAGDAELWVEGNGDGPDVLLIAGLGDPAEAWQPQLDGLADRYRLTAFDNRGAGRTPLAAGPLSAAVMADDAAALLQALEVPSADVAGFSMGSAIAQELALRTLTSSAASCSSAPTPARTLSSVPSSTSGAGCPRRRRASAPSTRAFFIWVYTPRAHADGTVDQIVEEALAFPHQQSVEAFQAQVDVCLTHDTVDRLPQITAPTLVLAGELDVILPPRLGRVVADAIPNAAFDVMPGEAHQPFQEVADDFNARVDAFWREVEGRGSPQLPAT
jgi:pimeloyl-ACP methyl ester carboxylesterase